MVDSQDLARRGYRPPVAGAPACLPLVVALIGCTPSRVDDGEGPNSGTGVESTALGPTDSASTSPSTTGTESSSSGTSRSSTAETTGAASVCRGDYKGVVATRLTAPAVTMPGWGIYFEATCDVTSADAGLAELMCDGGVGEVTFSVEGVPGLELAGLPEQVVVDMGQSLVFESGGGARHAISTPGGALLFAYVGVGNLGVLDDPWEALLPMELDWAQRDCPSTTPQTGVSCSPAMLLIETPSGTSEAPGGEVSAVSGGWEAFVSALAECVTEVNPYGDEVRFAIVSDTLL